jgi:Ca2+ transporting ATPase
MLISSLEFLVAEAVVSIKKAEVVMYCHFFLITFLSLSSSLPPSYIQDRKIFEKIGEPTEVALKVLAEKLNLSQLDRSSMSGKQLACSNFKVAQQEYKKLFTLEFSRDRKSMSVYCQPKDEEKPLMFVKVGVTEVGGA